jgi:circadian clock protein KaiC
VTKATEPPAAGSAPSLPRLTTGNRELDEIVGGGLPANSINIVMGQPGTGKTILVEHLMFANAEREGRPTIFLSTVSEPVAKVIRYLQQFEFFDESLLGTAVVYDSIGEELSKSGAAMLVPRIKELIVSERPKVIVIDSFKAIHDLSHSKSDFRVMLHELAGLLTAFETTAFLIGEYGAGQIEDFPEFAVADSILSLSRNSLSTRDERFLRVLKLRGSSYLEGAHAFKIGSGGLEVFPRLVSPDAPPTYEALSERVPTGVPGLDKLFDKGLLRGRSTFVVGPTGSGKTTFALQFLLEGLRRGEHCLYVSFEENPAQLDWKLRSLGADIEGLEKKGFRHLYVSPVELQIDSIVTSIFRTIRRGDVRRIAVDAIGDLLSAAPDQQRLEGYLYALAQHFAAHGVSTLFLYEGLFGNGQGIRLSALADNIVVLDTRLRKGQARRRIRIAKARGIDHDLDVHDMKITEKGLEVR